LNIYIEVCYKHNYKLCLNGESKSVNYKLAALGTFGDLSIVYTVGRVYFVNDN